MCLFLNGLNGSVDNGRVEENGGLRGCFPQEKRKLVEQLLLFREQRRIVLDEDERVVVLPEDLQQLEGCEGPANIEFREPAAQAAEYSGVVPAYVKNEIAL